MTRGGWIACAVFAVAVIAGTLYLKAGQDQASRKRIEEGRKIAASLEARLREMEWEDFFRERERKQTIADIETRARVTGMSEGAANRELRRKTFERTQADHDTKIFQTYHEQGLTVEQAKKVFAGSEPSTGEAK
jgi:hypothetical protein